MLPSVLDKNTNKQPDRCTRVYTCMPFYLQSKNRMGVFSRESREGESNEKETNKRTLRQPAHPIPWQYFFSFSPVLQFSLLCSLFPTPSVLLPCVFDQNPRKISMQNGKEKVQDLGIHPCRYLFSCRVKKVQVSIPMDPSWVESLDITRYPRG